MRAVVRDMKGPSSKRSHPSREAPAAAKADSGWQEGMLARLRAVIMRADPQMVEERKWRKPRNPEGVPTWSHGGLVCTGETYKSTVKITFARGASLKDPSRLFNSSLEGNARRAIDFHEGDSIDEGAFAALVRAAVAANALARGQQGTGVRVPRQAPS